MKRKKNAWRKGQCVRVNVDSKTILESYAEILRAETFLDNDYECECIDISWFYSRDDNLPNLPKCSAGCENWLAKELYRSTHTASIPVDSITGSIKVLSPSDFVAAMKTKRKSSIADTFFVSSQRYLYDIQAFEPEPLEQTDPFRRALSRLELSAAPQSLPCRQAEYSKIYDTVANALRWKSGGGRSVYVYGMPGTGKTATILRVVNALQEDLGPFKFVNINSARFDDPYNVYTELYGALTDIKEKPNKALQLLDARFTKDDGLENAGVKKKPKKRKKKEDDLETRGEFVVVLVDELDYLACPRQTVIYNLIDWPTRPASNLLVIGVSNTMNLPERLGPKIESRIVTKISFRPYTKPQVEEIVTARLTEKDVAGVFERDAITMASAKVAAYSGDIRRALKLCATAAEIRMDANGSMDPSHHGVQRVTVKDIQKADRDLNDSTVKLALRQTSFAEELIVSAIAAEVRVQGTASVDMDKVHVRIRGQVGRLRADGHSQYFAPSHAEVMEICERLQEGGMIRLDYQVSGHRLPALTLCIPDNAVAEALSAAPVKRFIPQDYGDWGF